MEIQEVFIEDLKVFSLNAKLDLSKNNKDYQDIKCSILKYGFVSPLIISEDLFVIDGLSRLKILKELFYEKVYCIKLDIKGNDAELLRLSLNKLRGDWKLLSLKKILKKYEQEIRNFNSNFTGFRQDEIDLIMAIDKFPDLEILDNNNKRGKQLNLELFNIKGE